MQVFVRRFIFAIIRLCALLAPLLGGTMSLAQPSAALPYLFHAGQESHILNDIQSQGISDEVWTKSIMGKTNFDLPPHRKGLYGSETISGTSLYYLYQILRGQSAAIMAFQIKSECLGAANVEHGNYSFPRSPFAHWYRRNRHRFVDHENKCLSGDLHSGSWEEGVPYLMSQKSKESQDITLTCGSVINAYLNESHVKLVYDSVNPDSWYLRDPSCIQSIKGTPQELLSLIFQGRNILEDLYADPTPGGIYHSGTTFFLFDIVARHPELTQAQPLLLKAKKIVDDDVARNAAPSDGLTLDRNSDNILILQHLLSASLQAIKTRNEVEFQKDLRLILKNTSHQLAIKCQGAHGVRPENQGRCSSETFNQTQKIVQLLQRNTR